MLFGRLLNKQWGGKKASTIRSSCFGGKFLMFITTQEALVIKFYIFRVKQSVYTDKFSFENGSKYHKPEHQ